MKHHILLCIKEITGNLKNTEKQILDSWIAESGENKKEYEKIKMIWNSTQFETGNSSPYNLSEFPDIDTEWTRLCDRLESHMINYAATESRENKVLQFFESLFKSNLKPVIGGAIVILLLITGLLLWNSNRYTAHIKTITTANKEQNRIELSDGSVVELNNASSIQFLETFNDEVREVRLKGEAFFSVTKDSRPFIVKTENANTKVLGTKFNIWTRGEVTRVVVKEGRVYLTPKKEESKGVVLSKDQLSIITKDQEPTEPKNVNTDFHLGWMNGKLVFMQTPLKEIVNEMKRYYDISITLENDTYGNYTLTGVFQNNDVDSVLTMICLTLDLEFSKHNDGYIIKTK